MLAPPVVAALVALVAAGPAAGAAAGDTVPAGSPSPDAALGAAFRSLALSPEEVHLDVDSPPRDAFRLAITDSLLARPVEAAGFLDRVARARLADTLTWVAWRGWREYAALLDAPLTPLSAVAEPYAAWPCWASDDPEPGVPRALWRAHRDEPEGLGVLLAVIARADLARRRALARLDPAVARWLEERSASLLEEEEDDPSFGPLEFRRREKEKEALADSVFDICSGLDRAAIAEMGGLAEIADRAARRDPPFRGAPAGARADREGGAPGVAGLAGWPREERDPPAALRGRVEGRIRLALDTPWGWVVLGGAGDNRYRGAFAAILEPGGDDAYELWRAEPWAARRGEGGAARSAAPETCAVTAVVDLGGDDRYRGRGVGALGSGYFGAGLLYDAAGDDVYEGGLVSLGAGWCGFGLLWDREGRDRYLAGAATEGIGVLGIGILRDDAGDDLYQAAIHAQGFAYVGGAGALEDRAGNDLYLVQPEVTSVLHYNDRSYSLAQGVSFGARPHWSGGLGLLLDGGGNDAYVGDLYAQGAAYWFGIGGVWDGGGHDHYAAYQYAQGSGVHRAVGLLLDAAGNDAYASKGVSQGVGHDLGLGLLRDLAGNDTYAATDLSQGAGSANGIGVLLDAGGLDGYLGKSERNVLGFGDYRREFESVGIALDLSGRDVRAPRGAEDSLWFGGTVGAGADFPGEVPPEVAWADTFKVPLVRRSYTDEEFFLMAASGEPRFSEWRAMGVDSLAARGRAALPFLVSRLGTENARERHTIKDIVKAIGERAVCEMLVSVDERDQAERMSRIVEGRGGIAPAVADFEDRNASLAAWIAGESQAPIGAAVLYQVGWHRSTYTPRLRAAALNALGKLLAPGADSMPRGTSLPECVPLPIGHSRDVPDLPAALVGPATDALRSDDEVLAKDAAFLLGSLGRREGIEPLLEGLRSPRPMVRTASRLALARYGGALPRALLEPAPGTSGASDGPRATRLAALAGDPATRAGLLLLAAEGARDALGRAAWAPALPALADDLDLADEALALAAARLVAAWSSAAPPPGATGGATALPPSVARLAGALRDSPYAAVRLLLPCGPSAPREPARPRALAP